MYTPNIDTYHWQKEDNSSYESTSYRCVSSYSFTMRALRHCHFEISSDVLVLGVCLSLWMFYVLCCEKFYGPTPLQFDRWENAREWNRWPEQSRKNGSKKSPLLADWPTYCWLLLQVLYFQKECLILILSCCRCRCCIREPPAGVMKCLSSSTKTPSKSKLHWRYWRWFDCFDFWYPIHSFPHVAKLEEW